jgi:anti-anti-sigma regulatory factor
MPVGKPILVDLANVSQVDSVDIGTFVSVWASARKSGCELKQSSWLVVVVIVVTTHTLLR